jgi:hypothetical protein
LLIGRLRVGRRLVRGLLVGGLLIGGTYGQCGQRGEENEQSRKVL